MIVQRLREIQNAHGFLPDAELHELARELGVPLYRIEEVSTFFPAFRLERDPPAGVEVRVCRDMTCHHRGAAELLDPEKGLPVLAAGLSRARWEEAEKAAGRSPGAPPDPIPPAFRVAVEGVSCLGRCDRAPAVRVERHHPPMADAAGRHEHAWVYAGRSPADLEGVIRDVAAGRRPDPDTDARYEPASNARYAGPAPRAAGWEIDVYAREGWPRDYRAVRRLVEFLDQPRPGRPFLPPKGLQGKELEKYVEEHHPLLWELKVSTLAGMGGAGAPAYTKRLDVWQQAGPDKYVVANGDESEPGTFKDRELLLRMPHLVVEGVIASGLMVGATAGYVFIRHEYPEQVAAVEAEIARAERLGACGPDLFGTGRAFPVRVFESPGGYICGEQSALLEAMEDRRGQPRNRPPDLTSNGLRDRPTVLNNVETLAWVPAVLLRGGAEYAAGGWADPSPPPGFAGKPPRFSGRRLVSVSGDVARPGVYEVPIGLPLGDLLTAPGYAGGLPRGLKAVATSGPSGGFVPATFPVPDFHAKFADYLARKKKGPRPADTSLAEWWAAKYMPPGAAAFDLLTAPLDLGFFNLMRELFGLPIPPLLGAGLVAYGKDTDTLDAAANFTRFFRNESCGKCVPCRVGSQKLVQIGAELVAAKAAGEPPDGGLDAARKDIADLAGALAQTSICSLGTSAPTPLASALAYFPGDAT